MSKLLVWLLPRVSPNPTFAPPFHPSSRPGCSDFSYAACSASPNSLVTLAMGSVTVPALGVATARLPSEVVTFPTTVLPSLKLTCRGWVELISMIAGHCTMTSPANSVLISRVLSSDFSMVPVKRSPFFNTIWSANSSAGHKKTRMRIGTFSFDTCFLRKMGCRNRGLIHGIERPLIAEEEDENQQ